MTWKISLPRGFLGVIFTVFASSGTHAQVSQLSPRVDAIFVSVDKRDSPGCALAVVQGGRSFTSMAMEWPTWTTASPLLQNLISTSPQLPSSLPAFAVALLEQQGKLSLNDPIVKYFPALPASVYGSVTVR